MSHFYKLVLGGSLLLATLVPQTASADFYVIPVGQSPIKTSSVKSFSSACLTSTNGRTALPYTVPEGKAFVVTSVVASVCNTAATGYGLVEIGTNYKQNVGASYGYYTAPVLNYNVGIVMNAGEEIFFTSKGGSSTLEMMISVNGYETRP